MKQVKEMGIVAVCLMLLGFGICMGIGTYLMYRDGEEEYDTLREYVDVEEPKENADSEDTEENQEETAELMTVTKKLLETWGILWSGNDQDITDPCVHKNGHWIVDHWFIINWKQLLGCDHSQWVKSGTGSTG